MPTPVEFVADKEPWCQYTLDDGSIVRVRVMLVRVIRDGLNEQGHPKYLLNMQQIVDCTPSELATASAKEEERAK